MIIDAHVYCFEPADSARGYASSEEHLKWVQALTPDTISQPFGLVTAHPDHQMSSLRKVTAI